MPNHNVASNVLAVCASEPIVDGRLHVLCDTHFQPLGFFLGGVKAGTVIRQVTIGLELVAWARGLSAMLFVPALPYPLIRELARLDPQFSAEGWATEHYRAFPIAKPGTSLGVEFDGTCQELAFWGRHLPRRELAK